MKTIYFICHDDESRKNNAMPILAIFTVDESVEKEDVIESFTSALHGFVPGSQDCPPLRFAAEKVCHEHDASFELVEADQEFGVASKERCTICGKSVESEDDLCPINAGFKDELRVCWDCHVSLREANEHTDCVCCGAFFTYEHLIPNKDDPGECIEICPYCGKVWCE